MQTKRTVIRFPVGGGAPTPRDLPAQKQKNNKIFIKHLTSTLLCAKVFLFPMKVSEVAMSQPILEVVPENLVRVPKVQGDHIAESLRQKDGADI